MPSQPDAAYAPSRMGWASSMTLGGGLAILTSVLLMALLVDIEKPENSVILLPGLLGGVLAVARGWHRLARLVAALLMIGSGTFLLLSGYGLFYFVAAILVLLGLGVRPVATR